MIPSSRKTPTFGSLRRLEIDANPRKPIMSSAVRLLVVDDDPELAESICDLLETEGYDVSSTKDGTEGLRMALEETYDCVITDFRLPGTGGMELLETLHAAKPRLPVIMMTAHSTTDLAIEATRHGAYDYLIKPFRLTELVQVTFRAVQTSRINGRPVELGGVAPDPEEEGDAIIGISRVMQDVYKEMGRVADKNVTVLLQGETGTGKELIARSIYYHSKRSEAPFIAVNCAAIPETLLESELFGHEKGAFTGADAKRIGRFEQANNGTLFLDEIGDMPMNTQVKILRVLQERVINRVGGRDEIPVDVRIITATHRNLEAAVRNGDFRQDLYYRLNAALLKIPPLRGREEDIKLLAGYFIERYCTEYEIDKPPVEVEALELLMEHDWPGNVRELENIIRKALLKCRGYPVSRSDIESLLVSSSAPVGDGSSENPFSEKVAQVLKQAKSGEVSGAYGLLLQDFEREVFSQAIQLAHGHQTNAAKWLGISRITLRDKLDRYELFPKRTVT
ncbi:MAG: nitrogen regulation protein NR(I) [Verrucomicrobiales bacterium]|jgi:nitrogen regulation protein NR(I)